MEGKFNGMEGGGGIQIERNYLFLFNYVHHVISQGRFT